MNSCSSFVWKEQRVRPHKRHTRKRIHVGDLRITKVEHFIQQLVNDDKVVANVLLLQLAKVAREDLEQFMQEHEYERSVGVNVGNRHHVQRVMHQVDVRHSVNLKHGLPTNTLSDPKEKRKKNRFPRP